MRLHTFRFSPNALKVRLAFAELGLEYQTAEVDVFRGQHRTDVFGKVNPFHKVPVLEHGDFVLRESNAIVVYLGREHGGSLWPDDPEGELIALQWLFFEAHHLAHGSGALWWSEVVAPRIQRPGSDAVVVADAARQLEPALELLEGQLTEHPYVMGKSYSLVDCAISVRLAMLRGTRADRTEDFPSITAYRNRIRKRPSWSACHGDALYEVG